MPFPICKAAINAPPDMPDLARQTLLLLFVGGLGWFTLGVLGPLLEPILWAIIITYATWPLYARIHKHVGQRSTLAAGLMITLLGVAVVLPLISLTAILQREAADAIRALPHWLEEREVLQERLAQIPYIGQELSRRVSEWGSDLPALLNRTLLPRIQGIGHRLLDMLGGAGWVAGQWLLALFLLFFLFRDGLSLTAEVRLGGRLAIGERADNYLDIAVTTSRAVLYGIVLTAIVQGSVAGIGYWAVDMPGPALLTLLTILMALIPFGASVVWTLACAWLTIQGENGAAIALLLWGALVVSWVDNLVRPIFISQATDIPFALVVLGIIGGLLGYGFLGLFLGPVILAIGHAAWEEWLKTGRSR